MLVRVQALCALGALLCATAAPALAGPPVVNATPAPAATSAPRPVYRPPVGAPTQTPISSGTPTTLGMVGIKSIYDRYLQAHTDGEMHASNGSRNTEETWFLIQVDKTNQIYALQNYRTGHLMSKHANGCAPANGTIMGPTEKWIVVSGKRYGVDNAVAFKSLSDGTYLGTNGPGNDSNCGGEVSAHSAGAPQGSSSWAGWWLMAPATTPTAGHDAWTAIGGVAGGIADAVSGVAGVVQKAVMPIDPSTLMKIENAIP